MICYAFRQRPINALCLPYSFSSALDFRLAGLRALGHAHEGRSLLLKQALPRPLGLHELQVYWDIGDAFFDLTQAPPARIGLRFRPTSSSSNIRAHRMP